MIVGTAGHIDHGKTALVRALTGVDTDRLKEEKARGISIDLGFAYWSAPGGPSIGFVDVPGHERFVRNMLAGATGIDFALLVVAADDGVMPQTREHLAILDLLGIARGVVALTKADLAGAEQREGLRAEIRQALMGTALAEADIVDISAVSGEGIEALQERLAAEARAPGERASDGRFRLAVDRCFTLPGAGTVVTGTVLSGAVSVGERVCVSPSGLAARVRSIHAQSAQAQRGVAGERCALNLAGDGIGKDAIARGDVVLDPLLHAPSARIDASFKLLASEARPVTQWLPVHLHHAATEVGARVVLLGDTPVAPGQEALVQLVLDRPIAAAALDRFVLRDASAQRTVGGGVLLDLRAPARKRRAPERLAQLQAHAMRDHALSLAALLERPPYVADLAAFARDRAIGEARMAALAGEVGIVRLNQWAVSEEVWRRFRRGIVNLLGRFHREHPDQPGLGLERVRMTAEPRLPAAAFRAAMPMLARAGEVAIDGAWLRMPGHSVRLTPGDEALWTRLRPLIDGGERFRPPKVRELAASLSMPEDTVRRLMKLLGRMGRVDEIAPDLFLLRDTVAEVVRIATEVASDTPDGWFAAAQLRDRLDNGRKISIQLLEFFDRHGVTLRRGDRRRMNTHRLDLFGQSDDRAGGSGGESSPVGRPDFKSGRGREPVFGGFDSRSLPPGQSTPRGGAR